MAVALSDDMSDVIPVHFCGDQPLVTDTVASDDLFFADTGLDREAAQRLTEAGAQQVQMQQRIARVGDGMLMFQHKAPHRNWQPSPKHLHMYDDVTIAEPANLFDDYAGRGTAARQQDMTIAKTMTPNDLKLTPPRNFTPEQLKVWNAAYGPKNEAFRKANLKGKDLVRWKYQRYMKDYLRCIASVDDNVGRMLDSRVWNIILTEFSQLCVCRLK